MTPRKRNINWNNIANPVLPTLILLLVLIVGTAGYYFLWKDSGGTFLDALFMTVTTITTIGYGEIRPLTDAGRVFTIFIAVLGIGSLFYVLGVFMENLVVYQIQNLGGKRKKMKRIEKMENHIIVVGSGRVGKLAATELAKNNQEFVIIDLNSGENENGFEPDDYPRVSGDATQDNVLVKAGIRFARGMIVTTANPATTVFVVLSAKVLNPGIFIVARADDDTTVEKLKIAGADRVVNPYAIGGQRLATLIINPHAVDFFETSVSRDNEDLSIENFDLPLDCIWCNKSLKDINIRQKIGATVLAIIRNGKALPNPDGNFVIEQGDKLLAMGSRQQLVKLKDLIWGK